MIVMATSTTSGTITTAEMSPAVRRYFSKGLLPTGIPNLIHTLGTSQRVMPRNEGNTVRLKGYNRLPTATTPVGSADSDPAPASVTTRFVDADIKFYMQYVRIEEQVQLTCEDSVLNEIGSLLGLSVRETEDELTRDVMAAGASLVNASNGTAADTPTELTAEDVYDVSAQLRTQNARFMTPEIMASTKIGTSPVRDAFLALTHTEAIGTLNKLDNFHNKNNYGNSNMGLPSEEGTCANVRFFVSSIGKVESEGSAAGVDVYNAFVMGRDSTTLIKQDGYSSRLLYGKPQAPLFRYATMGWKMAYAGRVMNDEFILKLRFLLD